MIAVRRTLALEAMAFHGAGESFAAAHAGDIDEITGLQDVDGALQELSSIVKERREYRPVDCEWVENRKLFTMELKRKDTNQCVDSRPMSADERQGKLDFDASSRTRTDLIEVDGDEKPAPKKRGKKASASEARE